MNMNQLNASRVDRPGVDDDNATSLKHGNKAFLDYMLNSVFVGSKWINWLVEPVIAYAHSPPQSEKSGEIEYYFNIWGIRKKIRKKGAQKKGGENSPVSPPLGPPLCILGWRCLHVKLLESGYKTLQISTKSNLSENSWTILALFSWVLDWPPLLSLSRSRTRL